MVSDARIRVALFADAYRDYVIELSRALAPLVDLTLVTPAGWHDACDIAELGVDTHVGFDRPRMRDPRSLRAARRLVRDLADQPVDLVHVQATTNPWMNLALRTTNIPRPLIETIHDVVRHPGDRRTPWAGARSARSWAADVDRFIVHTAGLGRDLTTVWGVPADRLSVVPHGELGSRYRRLGARPVEPDDRTVLFFGRIWPYKGLDVLVDALGRLPDRPPVRLIIAGRGEPIAPYLERLPASVECEVIDRYVDDGEVLDLFRRSTLVCLPYREASQSGVAAIAVGLGVPIVASDVGGIGETLRADIDAVLVPPGDADALSLAIGTLLDDDERRAAMSASLGERASSDLGWPAIADQTMAVYRSVLS